MNHFLIQTIKIQKGAKQNENSHKSNLKKKKKEQMRGLWCTTYKYFPSEDTSFIYKSEF